MQIIKEQKFELDILASTLASNRSYKFATLIPETNKESLFWDGPKLGIKKAYNELDIYSVVVRNFTFDQFDRDDYKRKIQELIQYQPDAVLFTPVFHEEAIELISMLDKDDIPFAYINSYLDHPSSLSFIGQDSRQSGYVAGKLMSFIVPADSDILIVNISRSITNHKHILKRKKGFEKYFHELKNGRHNIEVLNIHDMDEKNNDAILRTILNDNKRIGGIFVTNSKVYKVCNMLAKEKHNGIKVVGYDLLNENIKYLKQGKIEFLISQKPLEQGYNGIMTLFNHVVLKRQIKKKQFLPIDIITKENIQYYLDN
ncbi:MAG: substrate-binding domain-containing protein [Bacteroidales bacterium]|nr:substrate-binding domain-containing protein [Bacteroidales bacterium]